MNEVYGVKTSDKHSPQQVRDAIIECFYEAHKEIAAEQFTSAKQDLGESAMEKLTRSFTESIVRRAFSETGGDFNVPTKSSILAAMNYLREFSKEFRSRELIEKHYKEIKELVDKIES